MTLKYYISVFVRQSCDGGGINWGAAFIQMEGCTICGNEAASEGGGIYIGNSSGSVSNCIIAGNTGNYGGGIRCSQSILDVMNAVIAGNTCGNMGGGIYFNAMGSITNSIIFSNSGGYGLNCCLYDPQITYSNIFGNNPGELYNGTSGTISNLPGWGWEGTGCIADDPLFSGGALPADAGPSYADEWLTYDFRPMGCSPAVDTGTSTGAPSVDISGTLRPQGLDFDIGAYEITAYWVCTTGDDAIGDGSYTHPWATIQYALDNTSMADAIIVRDGTYTLSFQIEVEADDNGKLLVSEHGAGGCIIDGNNSVRCFNFNNVSHFRLEGFTLQHGVASTGGGIYCQSSSPTISRCVVAGNTASQYYGGGIYCAGPSTPIISECFITANTAAESGGGVTCFSSSSPSLINCVISGNNADSSGGSLFCNASSPSIINSTLYGNNAINNGSALFCIYSSSPLITNSIISSNSGNYGIYCAANDSDPQITYTNLFNHSPNEAYNGLEAGSIANFAVWGWGGTECISEDPQFIGGAYPAGTGPLYAQDWLAFDLHIQSTSPSVDSGTDQNAPIIDIEGIVRPQEEGFDMGAYEFSSTVPNNLPVLDPIGDKLIDEGEELNFTISATDPDPNQALTFSVQNLPNAATFDPVTFCFTWTPGSSDGQDDPHVVEFMVTDDGNPPLSAFETITITVCDVPYYISPVFYYANLPVTPNIPFVQRNDNTYSITPKLPDGLSLDPNSGIISGTPKQTSSSADYTITATNSTGTSSAVINISIQCGECAEGSYRSKINNQCFSCECFPEGSESLTCVDGKCSCKPGFIGDTCNKTSPSVVKAESDPQLLAIKDIWESCFQGTDIQGLVNAEGDLLDALERNPHLAEVLFTNAIGRGLGTAPGNMLPTAAFSAASGFIGRNASFFDGQSEFNVQIEGVTNSYSTMAGSTISPLVLDLNGDGIINTPDNTYLPHPTEWTSPLKLFDINGDGFLELTEWLSPGDGLLVKKPECTTIDGTHLFGSADGWSNGFEKLTVLDTNKDKRVTGTELADLAIWNDADSDALLDERELLQLATLGITEIGLSHDLYKGYYIINDQNQVMWDWFPNFLITRGRPVSGAFPALDIRMLKTEPDVSIEPIEAFLGWDTLSSMGVNIKSFMLGGINEGGWLFGLERQKDKDLEAAGNHFSLVMVNFFSGPKIAKIPLNLNQVDNAFIVGYGIVVLGDYGTKILHVLCETKEIVTIYEDNPQGEGIAIGSMNYSDGKVSLRGLVHNQTGALGEYVLSFDQNGISNVNDFAAIKQGIPGKLCSMSFIDDKAIYFTSRDAANKYLMVYVNNTMTTLDQGTAISDIWANRENVLYSIRRPDGSKQLILKNVITRGGIVLANDWFDYLFLSPNSRTVFATKINWATLKADYYCGLQEDGYQLKHLYSDYLGSVRLSEQGTYAAIVTPSGIHVKNLSMVAHPDYRPIIYSLNTMCSGGAANIVAVTSQKAIVRLDLWTQEDIDNSPTPGISIISPSIQYLGDGRSRFTFEGITIPDDITRVVLCAIKDKGMIPYNPKNMVSQPDAFQIPTIQFTCAIQNGPNLLNHPVSTTTVLDDSVTFSVTAIGKGPLSYQWKKDGLTIAAATTAKYTISPVEETDEGNYTCLVTNSSGATESMVAALIIKTYEVCNQLVMPQGGEPAESTSYTTIQSAVDAAEASSFPYAGIEICAGTYIEDVSIKTKKSIQFLG